MDSAQIHASNFIMYKNTSVNYLRMSARVEAVSAKLDTAIKMQTVTKQMAVRTPPPLPPVLTGHVSSLPPYQLDTSRPSSRTNWTRLVSPHPCESKIFEFAF
jgi:hypothetical protein